MMHLKYLELLKAFNSIINFEGEVDDRTFVESDLVELMAEGRVDMEFLNALDGYIEGKESEINARRKIIRHKKELIDLTAEIRKLELEDQAQSDPLVKITIEIEKLNRSLLEGAIEIAADNVEHGIYEFDIEKIKEYDQFRNIRERKERLESRREYLEAKKSIESLKTKAGKTDIDRANLEVAKVKLALHVISEGYVRWMAEEIKQYKSKGAYLITPEHI